MKLTVNRHSPVAIPPWPSPLDPFLLYPFYRARPTPGMPPLANIKKRNKGKGWGMVACPLKNNNKKERKKEGRLEVKTVS